MTHYIIRGDSVTAHTALPTRAPKDALVVSSADDIVTSDLPAGRLAALWNALPGIAPVAKFKDRRTAARRLWAAFEKLPRSAPVKLARPEKTRADTKQAQVILMFQRIGGATVAEIAAAMDWQAHTVRGMISGALKKKLGLDVVSSKEKRGRVYRIVAAAKRAA
jgi:hypothetical protein